MDDGDHDGLLSLSTKTEKQNTFHALRIIAITATVPTKIHNYSLNPLQKTAGHSIVGSF